MEKLHISRDFSPRIEDNFLDQHEFDKMQKFMTAENFPWFFRYRYYVGPPIEIGDSIENELDDFQFIHAFYDDYSPSSVYMEHLTHLLELLQPVSIWRIRANLLTRLPNIVDNPFHSDMDILPEEKRKHWTTSILYVNTNNGYTVFEDGTRVESVANRLLTFPANMNHTGTSCTDQPTRLIINLNYFK